MRRLLKAISPIAWILLLSILALAACSGNPNVSTGIGIHRSPSGDWGTSLSIGVHSHGRTW